MISLSDDLAHSYRVPMQLPNAQQSIMNFKLTSQSNARKHTRCHSKFKKPGLPFNVSGSKSGYILSALSQVRWQGHKERSALKNTWLNMLSSAAVQYVLPEDEDYEDLIDY